jgi:hypothetical protein
MIAKIDSGHPYSMLREKKISFINNYFYLEIVNFNNKYIISQLSAETLTTGLMMPLGKSNLLVIVRKRR